jgi:hypothetical protein
MMLDGSGNRGNLGRRIRRLRRGTRWLQSVGHVRQQRHRDDEHGQESEHRTHPYEHEHESRIEEFACHDYCLAARSDRSRRLY